MDLARSREYTLPALVLGLCLVLGGWVLGSEIKAMKMADHYVTVKGLVERTVKSDRAIWEVSSKTAGENLSSVFAKSEADKSKVLTFACSSFVRDCQWFRGDVSLAPLQ